MYNVEIINKIKSKINSLIDSGSDMTQLFDVINALKNSTWSVLEKFMLQHGIHHSNEETVKKQSVSVRANQFRNKMCNECGIECVYEKVTAEYVCPKCGLCYYDNDTVLFNGQMPYEEMTHFQLIKINKYSRRTNFRTILRNIQSYPSPLSFSTKDFIRTTPRNEYTLGDVKKMMKNRNLTIDYSNLHLITSILSTTYEPLVLIPGHRDFIIALMEECIHLFEGLKKEGKIVGRKNFVGYHYAMTRICNVKKGSIDLTYIKKHLICIKCKSTKNKQSKIWKLIVEKAVDVQSPLAKYIVQS
jgi:hypothetical protein